MWRCGYVALIWHNCFAAAFSRFVLATALGGHPALMLSSQIVSIRKSSLSVWRLIRHVLAAVCFTGAAIAWWPLDAGERPERAVDWVDESATPRLPEKLLEEILRSWTGVPKRRVLLCSGVPNGFERQVRAFESKLGISGYLEIARYGTDFLRLTHHVLRNNTIVMVVMPGLDGKCGNNHIYDASMDYLNARFKKEDDFIRKAYGLGYARPHCQVSSIYDSDLYHKNIEQQFIIVHFMDISLVDVECMGDIARGLFGVPRMDGRDLLDPSMAEILKRAARQRFNWPAVENDE